MSRLMGLKPVHVEDGPLEHRVRSELPKSDGSYHGPTAHVSADPTNGWLHIVTDDYEGAAMLNLDTLPALIKALRCIETELRAQRKAEPR